MTRKERYDDLCMRFLLDDDFLFTAEAEPRRYALVEDNRLSAPAHWITTFDSPEAAGTYHHEQEYAADWSINVLVDLDTGDEYDVDTVTRVTTTLRKVSTSG